MGLGSKGMVVGANLTVRWVGRHWKAEHTETFNGRAAAAL